MSKQMVTITSSKSVEELNQLLNEYLRKNDYSECVVNEEKLIKRNNIPGVTAPYYLKIYVEEGKVTIIAWGIKLGKEYGVDNDIYIADGKRKIRIGLENIITLLKEDTSVVTNEKIEEVTDVLNNNNLLVAALGTNTYDNKNLALGSLGIGIVAFIVPLPFYIAILIIIVGIQLGRKGLKSSIKVVAIIGLIINIINFVIRIINIIELISLVG